MNSGCDALNTDRRLSCPMPLPGTFLESQRVLADAIVLYPVLVSIGNTADAV